MNARGKLKKTVKKTEKAEKPSIQGDMPGGGPHVPLNPWFQFFQFVFSFFPVLFFSF